MELWNLPLSGLSERVTAHVHIPKSRLQETFLACSYTLCREMNFILWMQSTGNFFKCQIIFSCKQERWKWAASARSCVLSWEARSHQQITQVRSIFRGNIEYSLPPNMVHYTVKLLGLKISRTLKPIITRKSRYINYSIIWHVAFFSITCRRPFQFTPLRKGSLYDTATLCFLYLAVQGAFLLRPEEAFQSGNFQLKEEAKKWPLMCHTD